MTQKHPNYFLRVLISLDKLVNTILGGEPTETISARLSRWKTRKDKGLRYRISSLICGILEAIDPGHCTRASNVKNERPENSLMEYPYHGFKTKHLNQFLKITPEDQ